MHKMTLYFDPVSPWARVGLYVVSRYTKVWNLDLTLHPVNLGYIMKDSGNRPPVQVPNKGKWMWEDMERAEKFYGVKLRTPAGFPVNTMPSQCVLRSLLDEPKYKSLILPSTFAISDAMWGGPDLPVQTAEELYKILGPIWEKENKGQELKDLLEKVLTKEHRDRLKKEAKEVVDDKGAFGAPWMVVTRKDGATSHWFGSDRFEQMAAWLGEPYKGPFADNRPAAKL